MNKPLKLGSSYTLLFSPDGLQLATVGQFIWMWNCKSKSKQWRANPFPNPSNIAFSPNGTMLAVKNTVGKIAVLDTRDGSIIICFEDFHDGEGSNILFSPDGNFLVDGSWSGHIRVRDIVSGKTVFHYSFPKEKIRRIHTDKSQQIWIIEHQPKLCIGENFPSPAYFTRWQWPFANDKFDRLPLRFDFLYQSALSPDGSRIAIMTHNSLEIYRLSDSKLLVSISVDIGGTDAALRWSPDGSLLASVQNQKITIYRSHNLQCERTFSSKYPSDIAWSPNGRIIAIGDWTSGLMIN